MFQFDISIFVEKGQNQNKIPNGCLKNSIKNWRKNILKGENETNGSTNLANRFCSRYIFSTYLRYIRFINKKFFQWILPDLLIKTLNFIYPGYGQPFSLN